MEKMMSTEHKILNGDSRKLKSIDNESIDLVVTSPPYPMIKMWDDIFVSQNCLIASCIDSDPDTAFELMNRELDKVWSECFRVLKPGAFLCINIGDATRTVNGKFKLYSNHSRVLEACSKIGFVTLPNIIWRKQTNAPNKFMGSGMLPCGGYVTLEHEWILIFRKGGKRIFESAQKKRDRMGSAFFWEERNVWFSDVWEIKGTKQKMSDSCARERSAAYPFELPYRLINMFSQKNDVVLDPFLGIGTTVKAAMVAERNSVGYEIDRELLADICNGIHKMTVEKCNEMIKQRIDDHREFVKQRLERGKEVKHYNEKLDTPVMTSQEEEMTLNYLKSIRANAEGRYLVEYESMSDSEFLPGTLFSKVV